MLWPPVARRVITRVEATSAIKSNAYSERHRVTSIGITFDVIRLERLPNQFR
jgi:hypothetical protein